MNEPWMRGQLEKGSQLSSQALEALQTNMKEQRRHLRIHQIQRLQQHLYESKEHANARLVEQLCAERQLAAKTMREVMVILSKMSSEEPFTTYLIQRLETTLNAID